MSIGIASAPHWLAKGLRQAGNGNRPTLGLLRILTPLLLVGCGLHPPSTERPSLNEGPKAEQVANEDSVDRTRSDRAPQPSKSTPKADQSKGREPQLFHGSGQFIDRTKVREAPAARAGEDGVTLNFQQAGIKEVIHTVLGDILGKNFTVNPQVQGKVTFHTGSPLPRDKLIPALESVLQMHGTALVRENGLYKIVPLKEAAQGPLPPTLPGSARPGFQILVSPLDYIDAKKAHDLLKPFLPKEAAIHVNEGRNLLVLAGTASQLRGIQQTLELFDTNWLKGMSVGIIPIQNAKPQSLATKLRQLFGKEGETPVGGMLRFIPLQRLKAIMVVTQQKEYLTQAKDWIERLDRIGAGREGKQLFVYQVQSGKATHLAEILSQALGGKAQAEPLETSSGEVAPGEEAITVTSESRSERNAATGRGSPQGSGNPRHADPRTDPPSSMGESPQPKQNGRGPAQLNGRSRKLPTGSSDNGEKGSQGFQVGETRVIADQANNALLIRANQEDYQRIKRALEKLDTPPRQVLVKATIAEVTLTGELRYGVQWFLENHNIQLGGSDLTGQANLGFEGDTLSQIPGGFSYSLIDAAGQIRALLEALAQDSLVKVLSSPSVMVLNNQEATIRVGDEVPIQTGSATTTGGNVTRNFQFRDTGVILEVTPRVNAGGLIAMELRQEVTNVGSLVDLGNARQFRFNQRTIQSNVAVQSGETVVLGGLIQDRNRKNRTGAPFLSQIPILGALFGTRSEENERRELVVLITPKVLSQPKTSAPILQEIRNKMDHLFPLPQAHNHSDS